MTGGHGKGMSEAVEYGNVERRGGVGRGGDDGFDGGEVLNGGISQ